MFRALLLFPQDCTPSLTDAHVTLDPPLSITLLAPGKEYAPVKLAIERDAIFTTAVGHSSKCTLVVWHVTMPEVVEHMLHLVRDVLPPTEEGEPEPTPTIPRRRLKKTCALAHTALVALAFSLPRHAHVPLPPRGPRRAQDPR